MADFTGTDNNDALVGTDDNDNLYGLGGADFLKGLFGDDYIDGGLGSDRATYYLTNPQFGGVTVSLLLQGQPQNTGAQGWDTLVNIENLSGTPFSDQLTGDDNDNWLWGSPATLGNGSISSLNNDFLYGMGGNDLLVVGIGNHTIDGGTENDTLRFTENGAPEGGVNINLQLQGQAQDTGQGSWIITNIENLSGGTANDSLGGNFGANVLAGDSGNDSLNGRGGDDMLYGDGRIATNADNIITTTPDVSALGFLDGNDAIQGGFGNDQLYGGGGNDVLNGGFDNDLVDGGDGNDRAGFYQTDPNVGGVTVSLMLQGTAQNTGEGMDTLTNIEHLSGTPFSDNLTGDGGDNWLWGSAATYFDGTNNVVSSTNNDFLYGLGGNDLLTVGIGNHTVDGGADNDTLQFGENGASEGGITVNLNQQDGTAQNTGQGSWILLGIENVSSGVANDNVTGDGNANILAGNAGNDSLNGGGGDDTLYGDGRIATNFDQVITTTPDVATLGDPAIPADGNDQLRGGAGDDQLFGGGGDDYLRGDAGNDTIDGGSGTDAVAFLFSGGAVTFDASTFASVSSFTWSDGQGGTDTISNVEQLAVSGSSFDDVIRGSQYTISTPTSVANMLKGNGGNDQLYGGDYADQLNGDDGNDYLEAHGGDDFLTGDAGNDQLNGGTGNDNMWGGTGDDYYWVDSTGDIVTEGIDEGADTVNTSLASYTLGANVENLIATSATSLTGNALANNITAGAGNSTINGLEGDDIINPGLGVDTANGGAGADTLVIDYSSLTTGVKMAAPNFLDGSIAAGKTNSVTYTSIETFIITTGSANDSIVTGGGNDSINAGAGGDIVNGGGGNDSIIGGTGNDTMTGGAGNDMFLFGSGTGHDKITDFASTDLISFDASSGVSSFSQLTITQAGKDTVISWGSKGNDITLAGVKASTVNASEFQFGGSASAAVVQQSLLTSDTTAPVSDHGHSHALFTSFANDHLFG
jgi:Ca2+-binding RTX toxin-like protein